MLRDRGPLVLNVVQSVCRYGPRPEKARSFVHVPFSSARFFTSAQNVVDDDPGGGKAIRRVRPQADTLESHLDWEILARAKDAVEAKKPKTVELPIRNVHRTVGTILSNRVVTRHGSEGLPDGTEGRPRTPIRAQATATRPARS